MKYKVYDLTALSIPSVMSIRKKMTAQADDPGRVAMASGYTMNTSPGPGGDTHMFDFLCSLVLDQGSDDKVFSCIAN